MRPLVLAAFVVLTACPAADGDEAECAGPADCAPLEDAPCDGCAALAVELCVDGACAARGDDAVDVSIATLLIDRAIDGVNGLRFAVVASAPCAEAMALGDELSALASGQKTLTGGELHQDVGLGRVPEGEVTVVVHATAGTAGQGDVLGRGCADGLAAASPSLVVEQIDVAP